MLYACFYFWSLPSQQTTWQHLFDKSNKWLNQFCNLFYTIYRPSPELWLVRKPPRNAVTWASHPLEFKLFCVCVFKNEFNHFYICYMRMAFWSPQKNHMTPGSQPISVLIQTQFLSNFFFFFSTYPTSNLDSIIYQKIRTWTPLVNQYFSQSSEATSLFPTDEHKYTNLSSIFKKRNAGIRDENCLGTFCLNFES